MNVFMLNQHVNYRLVKLIFVRKSWWRPHELSKVLVVCALFIAILASRQTMNHPIKVLPAQYIYKKQQKIKIDHECQNFKQKSFFLSCSLHLQSCGTEYCFLNLFLLLKKNLWLLVVFQHDIWELIAIKICLKPLCLYFSILRTNFGTSSSTSLYLCLVWWMYKQWRKWYYGLHGLQYSASSIFLHNSPRTGLNM